MKSNRTTYRTSRSRETIQHYAIRAHLALDEIQAGDLRTQWLVELGCYCEIAWKCGLAHFKNPPRAIGQAKALLIDLLGQAETDQLPAALTDEQWQSLCDAVNCSDGVWQRIPDELLFRVMYLINSAIQQQETDVLP
jgi:hypothetical protein